MVGVFFKNRYQAVIMSEHVAPGNDLILIRRLLDILRSAIPATIESPMTTHVPFGQLCLIPFLFHSLVLFCCVADFCVIKFRQQIRIDSKFVEIKNSTVTLFNQLSSTNEASSQVKISKI